MTSETDRSIPELFGDAMSQLAKLVGNEFALAREELSEKAAQAGRAAALIGAGAILMIPGDRCPSLRSRRCPHPERLF